MYLKEESLNKSRYLTLPPYLDPKPEYLEFQGINGIEKSYLQNLSDGSVGFFFDTANPLVCFHFQQNIAFNRTQLNDFYEIYGISFPPLNYTKITINLSHPYITMLKKDAPLSDKYISLIILNIGPNNTQNSQISWYFYNKTTTGILENVNFSSSNISLYFYLVRKPEYFAEVSDIVETSTNIITRTISFIDPNDPKTTPTNRSVSVNNLDLSYTNCEHNPFELFQLIFGYPFDCYKLPVTTTISNEDLGLAENKSALSYYSVTIKPQQLIDIDDAKSTSFITNNGFNLPISSMVIYIQFNRTLMTNQNLFVFHNELGVGFVAIPTFNNSVERGPETPSGSPYYFGQTTLPLVPPFGNYDIENVIVLKRGNVHLIIWAISMIAFFYLGYRFIVRYFDKKISKPNLYHESLVYLLPSYVAWALFLLQVIGYYDLRSYLSPVLFLFFGGFLGAWQKKEYIKEISKNNSK